ncbi:MAG: translesion DNA synthesis-associated protein ImuA [bacterium]
MDLLATIQNPTAQQTSPESRQQDIKNKLLRHPDLWRAGQLAQQHQQQKPGIPSGYQQLDQHLPGKGWPAAGLMEFMLTSAGVGELRLLVPALQQLGHSEARWLAWINPPFIPYAPALQSVGIDTSKILLVHPRTHMDALWALERACKSGSCSMALAWLDEKKLKLKDTQRLQVAAKQGQTLTCLFRPKTALTQSSMAELRVALNHLKPGQLSVDILKRRGGWPVSNVLLPVADTTSTDYPDASDVQHHLEVWRAFTQQDQGNAERLDVAPAATELLFSTPSAVEPSPPLSH